MSKTIPLTQGKFAIVDDEDFINLAMNIWHYDCGYAARTTHENGKKKTIRMHAVINKTPKGLHTDHINRNKLDNRKENLRTCSLSQNLRNRGKQSNNTSGYKGVCWHKRANKWVVFIEVNKKQLYLGLHENIIDAARTYNAAAKKHYGEFAKLNNIEVVNV